MGVNISSKNIDVDLGYSGFMALRRDIAALCPREIREQYFKFTNNPFEYMHNSKLMEEYDAKTDDIYNRYKDDYGDVIDFLYASDCGAEFSHEVAKKILKLIGDRKDNHIIGYAGRSDAARFQDFVSLLKDSVDTETPFEWS